MLCYYMSMLKKHQSILNKFILFSIFLISAVLFSGCNQLTTLLPNQETQTEQTQSLEISATPELTKTEYSFTAAEDGQIALNLAQATSEGTSLQIETIDYGTAGKFVSSINGLSGNNQNYWAFYVNGEYAQAGASQTILKKGDIITFTYEEVTFE